MIDHKWLSPIEEKIKQAADADKDIELRVVVAVNMPSWDYENDHVDMILVSPGARFRKKKIAEANQVKMAKIISLCIGVVIVLLSLVIGNVKGNLLELTYKTINLLVAPLFVPFFMAMFVRSARPTGTFIGTIISAVVASLIGFSDEVFAISISFLWMIPVSFVAGVIVSWVLSLLPLGQKPLPSSQ